ncbi:MAG: ARMT1-like domain-containing protein [Kiritimatiellaceae bacterium]|nr:ARMT1-like domain-containing protein [Kiritimatiellaceae bacterium]
MKTFNECIPCFARQGAEAAQAYAPNDPKLQQEVLRTVLRIAAEGDYEKSPPEIAADYFRAIVELTGVSDPYAEAKRRSNEEVMKLLPRLRKEVEESARPLETALRIAIAGNIIDFGTPHGQKDNGLLDVIGHAVESDMCMDSFAVFEQRAKTAELILYLGDNCGEVVLDQLLIEQLPTEKVIYVVRGKPILNDITPAEVPMVGIDQLCRVIDNGHDAPGTLIEECSLEFRELFARADMIISKGQGNFETLQDCGREIFFLMKVKCEVVAMETGLPMGSIFFKHLQAR